MKTIIAILAVVALAGCTTYATPAEVRSLAPETKFSFEVDAPYETVYRRIAETARACYQANMLTANQIVNADIYPESRSGSISAGMYGIAAQVYWVIDIHSIDNRTRVDGSVALGKPAPLRDKINAWAIGTPGC